MGLNNVEKGELGERIAEKYLISKGIKIICKNYRCKLGEVDIIAILDKILIFIEVKARSSDIYGRPCEAVDFKKQNKIKSVARYYILINKLERFDIRFDVVEVYFKERRINYIENAF